MITNLSRLPGAKLKVKGKRLWADFSLINAAKRSAERKEMGTFVQSHPQLPVRGCRDGEQATLLWMKG